MPTGVAGYLAWQPWMLRWGATNQVQPKRFPAMTRTPHPHLQSTRAITSYMSAAASVISAP